MGVRGLPTEFATRRSQPGTKTGKNPIRTSANDRYPGSTLPPLSANCSRLLNQIDCSAVDGRHHRNRVASAHRTPAAAALLPFIIDGKKRVTS